MNALDQFGHLLEVDLDDMISRAEDPERRLDDFLLELDEPITSLKEQLKALGKVTQQLEKRISKDMKRFENKRDLVQAKKHELLASRRVNPSPHLILGSLARMKEESENDSDDVEAEEVDPASLEGVDWLARLRAQMGMSPPVTQGPKERDEGPAPARASGVEDEG